jgi:manganese/iron transport system permease protein/iron/zinc/copper transport system permease protein
VNWFTDPLTHGFFRHGLAAGIMGGALCGLVGVYVVLKRMSYIGHGLSHAIFGGAAVAYVLNWNFYLGAGAWGVLSALLINGVARRRKIGADAAIGVVTTASFAIGVALISSVHRFAINLEAALFGNILGVTIEQLFVLLSVLAFTAGAIFLRYRQLLFSTFDPEASDAYGISSRWSDTLLALVLAATIVATMQSLGVTLIAATIVIPAVIARLLTDSFARMLLLSTAIGAVAGAIGIYVSYYVDVPPGAAIVLMLAAVFAIVYAVTAVLSRRRLQILGTSGEHTDLAGPAVELD